MYKLLFLNQTKKTIELKKLNPKHKKKDFQKKAENHKIEIYAWQKKNQKRKKRHTEEDKTQD